jgi:hypothetical protein
MGLVADWLANRAVAFIIAMAEHGGRCIIHLNVNMRMSSHQFQSESLRNGS